MRKKKKSKSDRLFGCAVMLALGFIVALCAAIAVLAHNEMAAQRESIETLKAMNATVVKIAEDARCAHHVPPPVPARPLN